MRAIVTAAISILILFYPSFGHACSMYKITQNAKTIVGNNEDYISPNSQFWFEKNDNAYGVMYMGLLDNFAQGAINEKGLMFDGFFEPYLAVSDTLAKQDIPIADAIRHVMQTMSTVEDVKSYLTTVNLSSLTNGQLVFVDQSGTYLIVEGDVLELGEESEKSFSNFYYSQIESLDEVPLDYFQSGRSFVENTVSRASLDYCGSAMKQFSQDKMASTQYSTIYDLNTLIIRVYLFHDYSEFVEVDLMDELKQGNHKTMIAELFPKDSKGYKHYESYNNAENPTRFIQEMIGIEDISEEEFVAMGMDNIIRPIAYEWLYDIKDTDGAIRVFQYGLSLMPSSATMHKGLADAYYEAKNWDNAVKSYARVLSINTEDQHAIERIQEIQAMEQYKVASDLLDKLTRDKLDSIFAAFHKPDEPGSAFGIIKNGEVVYLNQMGLANIEHHLPITDKSVFNIASVSKQFTTYLALHLEDEGKLSFQDDIRKYLPELKGLPYKISVEQLCNHTHGLANADELAALKGQTNMHFYEVLEMLLNIKTTNFKPGEDFQYNNTGYILLSQIIERVGEKPFKQQLEEVIFKPLGMNDTKAFDYRDDVIPNKAYSYKKLNSGGYVELPSELATIGSSGIYSSLQDMLLWANNFQETTVGKPVYYGRMQETVTPSSHIPTHYGLGLEVNNHKGIDIVFHGGGSESYRSYILHAPDYGLSFVFLSNKRSMAGLDVVYSALEILVPENQIEKDEASEMPSTEDLKSYEGVYEVNPGLYFRFFEENGEFYGNVYGQEGKMLLPKLDKNVFKDPSYPHATFTFLEDRVDYQIADMIRYCYKLDLPQAPNYNTTDLEQFTGLFKNEALDTRFEIAIEDGQLHAKRMNQDIILSPMAENQFSSGWNFFGRIDFILDGCGKVKGFKVSGQNLEDIVFVKE